MNLLDKIKTIFNNSYVKFFPYVIILILGIFTYTYYNRSVNLSGKIEEKDKITAALNDTVKYYKNAYNEIVAEKKTIQMDLNEAKKYSNILSNTQSELLSRVKELEKKYTVIAAGIIETKAILSDLRNDNPQVNEKDSTISFPKKTDEYDYNIIVGNVRPIPNVKPYLFFDKFELPNKQTIDFHWNKEPKEGYPVSFSVSNSNPLFVTTNIDSYIIPEIKRQEIKPTFWKRVGNTFKEGGNSVVYIGLGVGIALLLK